MEIFLEDSKTGGDRGGSRYVTFVGKTKKSGFKPADNLRELWKAQGTFVVKGKEQGFNTERPDYSVVRVSLLDMDDQTFKKFVWLVKHEAPEPVAATGSSSISDAKSNRDAKTIGEHERFVNIAGGRREGPEIKATMAWMASHGLGRFCSVGKGPLIRKPKGYMITHMPLKTPSADHHIRKALDDAYEALVKSGVHDPELDVPPGMEPQWGQHSMRREADRVAQATRHLTLVSNDDIDFFFGWNLKELLSRMQVHYQGQDRMGRLGLARVTSLL